MNVKESINYANRNRDKMLYCFPANLSKKESRIFTRLSKSKRSPEKKLESLYDVVEELHSFVSKFTPCKKGCSSCCHYKVSISEIEIRYIENNEGIRRLKKLKLDKNYHGDACPFLVANKCSIYSSRPYACRNHVVFNESDYWCHPDLCNDIELPLISFSEVKKSYDLIRRTSESYEQYDIRQVFE